MGSRLSQLELRLGSEQLARTDLPFTEGTSCISRCANVRSNAGVWSSTRTGTTQPKGWAMSKPATASQFTGKPGFPGRNCSHQRVRVQSGQSFGGLGKRGRKPTEGVLDCGIRKPVMEGLGHRVQSPRTSRRWEVTAGNQALGH